MLIGACGTIVFFVVATLITDVLFEQFLLGEHSRQRAVMDTSLSDTTEGCGTIDAECVGLSVSQSILFPKKVNKLVHLKNKNFQLE